MRGISAQRHSPGMERAPPGTFALHSGRAKITRGTEARRAAGIVRIVAQPRFPNFLFSLCLCAEVPVKGTRNLPSTVHMVTVSPLSGTLYVPIGWSDCLVRLSWRQLSV
jgi:hypothetical protein